MQAKIKMFNGLFICLYALTFFFDDFGPNLTTFGTSLPPFLSNLATDSSQLLHVFRSTQFTC